MEDGEEIGSGHEDAVPVWASKGGVVLHGRELFVATFGVRCRASYAPSFACVCDMYRICVRPETH